MLTESKRIKRKIEGERVSHTTATTAVLLIPIHLTVSGLEIPRATQRGQKFNTAPLQAREAPRPAFIREALLSLKPLGREVIVVVTQAKCSVFFVVD